MPLLGLVRHAPTDWNAAGRIQGHTDTPLSEAGRAMLAGWEMPPTFAAADWYSSPLQRCRETARHLAGRNVPIDPLLKEMDWGDWQGETLADLRARLGGGMADAEALGWDFRPPNGESPRDLSRRLMDFLAKLGSDGDGSDRLSVAVTHRGVIRVAFALATGWDFLGKPPFKMQRAAVQLFWVGPGGALEVRAANLRLGEGGD
jgi:broad specificity phosphatase PhoE